jgi:hypothetical protein
MPDGWKLIAVASPMIGAPAHSLLGDRIAAGYVDRIEPTVVCALSVEDLINLCGVEIDRWRLAGGRAVSGVLLTARASWMVCAICLLSVSRHWS